MTAATHIGKSGVYLQAFLAPLADWIDRTDVTDVLVNRPGEVWFETREGGLARTDAPAVTAPMLRRLAQQIAASSSQAVNREHPLLSATLPGGARVQVVAPPATRGHLALAVRKHDVSDLTLDDYDRAGAFNVQRDAGDRSDADARLSDLLANADVRGFLREAVKSGKNIVISGGTGSGKTTLLNALLKEVPHDDRIIIIEDSPEVHVSQPSAVGLIAVRGELGESKVGMEDLLQAALRMRPDRLLLGEIRGPEAISFLRAVNTGHPGSMTTVHANSPEGALEQIALMAMQARVNLSRSDVIDYAMSVIDVIVQLSKAGGKRHVSSIRFKGRTIPVATGA